MKLKKKQIPWNKGLKGEEYLKHYPNGVISWNKGLTKETDERMLNISRKNIGRTSCLKGTHLLDSTKKKISESSKGRRHSEKTKRKMSNSHKGRIPYEMTDIIKSNMSKAAKGRIRTQKSCQKGIETRRNNGKPWCSTEHKKKISDSLMNNKNFLGKKHTDENKKLYRELAIKRIETQRLNGIKTMLSLGKYEKHILDTLEDFWDCKIQRQKRVAGYFIDGFCPMFNLAIEIDEPYHKKKEQLNKDKYREEQINKELQCSFLRIEVGRYK